MHGIDSAMHPTETQRHPAARRQQRCCSGGASIQFIDLPAVPLLRFSLPIQPAHAPCNPTLAHRIHNPRAASLLSFSFLSERTFDSALTL